ncbi:hypothetical protein EDC04DRAFT_2588605 [Pisolithus marmoratus]|nr:hypothetical protein EDC04DRAFT_2588605 [Pisolithus marmoratus]
MQTEYTHSCPMWRNKGPCMDCVFIGTDPEASGMHAYSIVHVVAFFSFNYKGVTYPCAAICWFDIIGNCQNQTLRARNKPDDNTGMWMVHSSHQANNSPLFEVIHLDTIYHAAHLIPIYGMHFISPDIKSHNLYDAFHAFKTAA